MRYRLYKLGVFFLSLSFKVTKHEKLRFIQIKLFISKSSMTVFSLSFFFFWGVHDGVLPQKGPPILGRLPPCGMVPSI